MPARIYYKWEGVSPPGSHKPNTAVAQAYYNMKEGTARIATETGAGQWGSALAFTGIFGVFSDLGLSTLTVKVVYLVALSVIFSAFSGMFNSVFQAFEKMEYVSVGRILSSALMLGGALFAISHGFSVVGFASIYFIVSAVGLGYSFVVCAWKFAKPKVEVDWSFWKPTMKEALPFG